MKNITILLCFICFELAVYKVAIVQTGIAEMDYNWFSGKYYTNTNVEPLDKLMTTLQKACPECEIIIKADKADFIIQVAGNGPYAWTLIDNRSDGKLIASKSNIFKLSNVMKDVTAILRGKQ